MTDETKKLFDAPWHVGVCEKGDPEFESVFLAAKTGWLIGRDMDDETSHRLARLPELYDALNKQAYYRCVDCLRHTANTIDDIPLNRDMIEHGCPKNRTDCGAFDAWKLLRKVRDGK